MVGLLEDRFSITIPSDDGRRIAGQVSTTVEFLVATGRTRLGEGDSYQAARLFQAATRLGDDSAGTIEGMALAFARQGRPGDALDVLQRLPPQMWPRGGSGRGHSDSSTPARFVVLFSARAGSSWLRGSLNANPAVIFAPEVLTKMIQQGRSPAEQRAWLRLALQPPGEFDGFAVGLKTKLSFPDRADAVSDGGSAVLGSLDSFADVLRESGARVIHLARRNVLKVAISGLNRRRMEPANIRHGGDRLGRFAVRTAQIDREVAVVEARSRRVEVFARSLDMPLAEIVYEEMLADMDAVVARVAAFLGVPHTPAPGYLQKNTPDDLRLALSNFDEIAAHLAGSPYSAMLHEVIVD